MVCEDDSKLGKRKRPSSSKLLIPEVDDSKLIELKHGNKELLTNMSYLLGELKTRLYEDKETGLIDSTLSATGISYLTIDSLLEGGDVAMDIINKLCVYYGFKYQLIKLDS